MATDFQSRTSKWAGDTSCHFNTISSAECCSGFDIAIVRGPNKPPKKNTSCTTHHQSSLKQNDTKDFQESDCVGATKNDNTRNHTMYHQYASSAVSQTTAQNAHPSDLLQNLNNFAAADCERDNCNADNIQCNTKNNLDNANHLSFSAKDPSIGSGCGTRNSSMYSMDTGKKASLLDTAGIKKVPVDSKPQEMVQTSIAISADCYKKLTYAVLVGDTVRTCNTKLYASLPLQDKYMVKQRVQYPSGVTRIKLVLKSSHERLTTYYNCSYMYYLKHCRQFV